MFPRVVVGEVIIKWVTPAKHFEVLGLIKKISIDNDPDEMIT